MHYMSDYPGNNGVILAMACLGVPFIAGAKLLDSVRPAASPQLPTKAIEVPRRHGDRASISRNQPKARRWASGSKSPTSHRTD
jgi:hypothetical protein